MFKGSFWYPTTGRGVLLLLAVVLMVPLHQSELLGLQSTSTLVFGWIPLQLAYDVAYLLVGVGILYVMYREAPEPPAEHEPLVDEEEQVSSSGGQQEQAVTGGEQ